MAENRTIYDLRDIGIRFSCQKCGSATFVLVRDWKTIPPACSQCDQQWFADAERRKNADMLRGAFERVLKDKTDAVKIQFEASAF